MKDENKNRIRALKAWETIRKNKELKSKKLENQKDYNNKEKQNQREILLKLLSEISEGFDERNPLKKKFACPKVVYLESPQLLFTKMIQNERKFSEESKGLLRFRDLEYNIPNNIEFDKFIHGQYGVNIHGQTKILFEEHIHGDSWHEIENTILINSSYKEFIKNTRWNKECDYDKFNYVFIWADYCGAFSSFKEDIDLTFSKKILGNGSIFALTFSIRDMARDKKLPEYSKTNCIVALNNYVSKCAKKYGYVVELLPESGNYKKTMYTGIFKVTHPQMTEDTMAIIELQKTHDRLINELEYKINKLKKSYE